VLCRVGVPGFQFLTKVREAQVEQAGFDAAQALEAPGGHDYLVDEQVFGGAGGLVLGLESFESFLELFLILVGEDCGFGGEAVTQSVEADGGASLGSARAGAFLGVLPVGVDLSLGGHMG
jgi:hypothetical protein